MAWFCVRDNHPFTAPQQGTVGDEHFAFNSCAPGEERGLLDPDLVAGECLHLPLGRVPDSHTLVRTLGSCHLKDRRPVAGLLHLSAGPETELRMVEAVSEIFLFFNGRDRLCALSVNPAEPVSL
ncbi:hypothetical protein R1flu_022196 [Riccia fluitans]|uniref:Uncharacterized protein n=1 Tax=Riccia fluitans TaxID=41844 RepID=A0ABD1ZRK2_9MARC